MNTHAVPDSTSGPVNVAGTSSPVLACGETGQDAARGPDTPVTEAASDRGGFGSPFTRALITADTYLAPLNSPVLASDTDVVQPSAASVAASGFLDLPQPIFGGELPLSPAISKPGEARPVARRTSSVRFSPYVAVKTYSLEEGRQVTRSVKAFWEGCRKQKKLKAEQKRVQDQLAALREQLLRAEEKRALARKSKSQKRKRE